MISSATIPTSESANHCKGFVPSFQASEPLKLFNSTYVEAGGLNISLTGQVNQFPFCRVYAQVAYGNNDTLNFEVWLPDAGSYNKRLMAVGNGGMAGVIDTWNLMLQLNSGFAVAGGDSGHLASLNNNGSGAPDVYLPYLHDPDQVKAWIHDSIAIFMPHAKALVAKYYAATPSHAYYYGCSTGGAQAFALAQYHPELFDGIVAGCPGNWYSHLALSFLWNAQRTQNGSYLDQPTLDFITSAVLDHCDSLDGIPDRVLENPLDCTFDITSLTCPPSSSSNPANVTTCLTPSQLAAAKAIYNGPGASIYPGFSLGSETQLAMQEGPLSNAFTVPILQNLVYYDLTYDATTFDWSEDITDVDEKAGRWIDEISPDLSEFRRRGGKMIVFQGWADPYNAAVWPIQHLHQIQSAIGGKQRDVSDFFNLFMIPGGGHCGAASSYPQVPATYHTIPQLITWVEQGRKPESIKSTDPPDGSNRSRKLCPWPQTAMWDMSGDVEDAESWRCV
ncbi:tannase and feruloyl esterase [Zopfia rhizophila CBS 207.26]|uniref:Carboxylic ester hydrolase n=1 Tax=Zopfia rhizophila CBS 207.26 TaxID=1314779 RepID=A0A6A6DD71_9PEZI|nr:tannase and feruloyl esterase [Zopfia rhizophila CBS 207.26]